MLKQASSLILGSKRCSTSGGEYVRSVIFPRALRGCPDENSEGQT
jgi:hypothetical protein